MIQQFEGFFKPKGVSPGEATSQLITVFGQSNNSSQTDGYWHLLTSVAGSSAFQFDFAPVQDKLVVGCKVMLTSHSSEFAELGAGPTDTYNRTLSTTVTRSLPGLPTLVLSGNTYVVRIVKPGSLVRQTPVEDTLASWTGTSGVLRVETNVEIEYDFLNNKIRAYVSGALVLDVDYEFTETQRTTPYRPSFTHTRSGATGGARLFAMYYADEPVGNFNVVRLLPNADGPSLGFPDGSKFDKVVDKTNGLRTDSSAKIEFGLQDLPLGAVPMAVMCNASMSVTHVSARSTEAEIRIVGNGDSIPTVLDPVPSPANSHIHLVKELPTQPNGQPWSEGAVNSLTLGMEFAVTEPDFSA